MSGQLIFGFANSLKTSAVTNYHPLFFVCSDIELNFLPKLILLNRIEALVHHELECDSQEHHLFSPDLQRHCGSHSIFVLISADELGRV
jgi:hypothetical protein